VDIAAILPLAIVMVAGPQIISAFFFATSPEWKGMSAVYVLGAAVSIPLVVTIGYLLANKAIGGESQEGTDLGIVALLLFAMFHKFRTREESEPPKWMGKLQTATTRFALVLGFLLLGFFPSDLVTALSVGGRLGNNEDPLWHAIPYIVLTLLLLGLPALGVAMLGERAQRRLPKIRDWMNDNSWIVSEVVLAFFVVIVLTG
jgi:hypothetical protein